jgi:hypothetical protein
MKKNSGQAAVLMVVGWHATEPLDQIIQRKCIDINVLGYTIWVYQSQKAGALTVQQFGRDYPNALVYFLEGRAYPTVSVNRAENVSEDGRSWMPIANDIGKVTGKLPGAGLVITELRAESNHEIDLWKYCEVPGVGPVEFRRGASTVCVCPVQEGLRRGMKSRFRKVVAVARLAPPYALFLK